MKNKNGEYTNKDTEEKDKTKTHIASKSKRKKQPVAKDLVDLKHVEVKKQESSQETIDLATRLKEQIIEHDQFERLSNDELTILESITNKRLFLTRIAIIVNQSRIPLGIEPFKKADLEKILDKLISKGYIEIEKVGDDLVYYLTERGKYRIQ
jgi:predicted transcriptional regulator